MKQNNKIQDSMNENFSWLYVSQQQHDALLNEITGGKKVKTKLKTSFVLVMVMALLAAVALAATNPSFQVLLSRVGDQIAVALQPIKLVSESNGIRMEVVAAMNDDSNAIAYITL